LPFVVFIATLVAIVYLWRNIVQPAGMVGFVETNQVFVASLQDGLISNLRESLPGREEGPTPLCRRQHGSGTHRRHHRRRQGRPPGHRGPRDVDITRERLNLQQLVVNLFLQRIQQAAQREELIYAQTNLDSALALRSQGIAADLQYRAALAKRDALSEEIKERDRS